jgi:hypothetical protein
VCLTGMGMVVIHPMVMRPMVMRLMVDTMVRPMDPTPHHLSHLNHRQRLQLQESSLMTQAALKAPP